MKYITAGNFTVSTHWLIDMAAKHGLAAVVLPLPLEADQETISYAEACGVKIRFEEQPHAAVSELGERSGFIPW